jgi:DNA-binding MarR family transcriptional regulator
MRRVRDVIRMKAAGLPSREIARRMGAAPSTVRLTIRRFEAAGLSWPLPDELTDAALEARLLPRPAMVTGRVIAASPSPTGRRCTVSSSAST